MYNLNSLNRLKGWWIRLPDLLLASKWIQLLELYLAGGSSNPLSSPLNTPIFDQALSQDIRQIEIPSRLLGSGDFPTNGKRLLVKCHLLKMPLSYWGITSLEV